MGGMITLSAGHDAKYYTSQMGGAERSSAQYYLSATEKQGEPQGIWVGEGLADLGIHDGDKIDAEVFEAIYGAFVDPATGESLGKPPRVNAELRKLFEEKKAQEPGLTRERERALWIEARAEVKSAGVMFWDSTFSVDKTISLAHATALASAEKARLAGDLRECKMWEDRATSVWAEIEKAAREWVTYAQSESRIVRTGHHGRRLDGQESGRFEDSAEIPVAMFPQHTNRNGDIHLHVHVLWLNRVKTLSDGKWRAADSRSLHRIRGAGSAMSHLSLETALAQKHGFEWVFRPASRARVIKGCPAKAIGAHSSRRAQIAKATLGLVDQYKEMYGREPDRRATWSMSQYAQRHTRQAKPEEKLDFGKLLSDWEHTSREAELGSLTELAQSLWDVKAQAQAELKRAGELSPAQERELMTTALANAQQSRAVFSRESLIHWLAQSLPDYVVAKGPEHARPMLEELTGRVLAGEGGDKVHCVTAGEFPRVPDRLRRANGESLFRAPGGRLFATEAQLTTEQRIIALAQSERGPHLSPEVSAGLLGADLADIEEQLWGSAQTPDAVTGSRLRLDQAAVVHHMLTSHRRVEVGVAIAGAGKTFMAGRAADAWTGAGMGRVIGTALSSNARDELAKASGVIEAYNLAELLGDLPDQPGARGAVDLGPDALLIVDEASMVSLDQWARLLRLAEDSGAAVRAFGDTHQLMSPEAGGGLSMLARKLGFAQVNEAVRFHDQWQRDASVALRAGDVQALADYDTHGRLHAGSYEVMAEVAARAFLADYLAGKDSLLLANSNAEARDLNQRAQGYLREWGRLGNESVPLREDARAYSGDLLTARDNRKDGVLNGTTLRMTGKTREGVLVQKMFDASDGTKTWGPVFELPGDYVSQHADLGYARTWMTSQGRTVADSAHSLVPSTATRNGLYESLTRARAENHGWFYEADPDCPAGQAEPEVTRARWRASERRGEVRERAAETADAVTLAARVLQRLDEPLSATEVRERSFSDADSLAVLMPIWMDQVRNDGAARYQAELRELLGDDLTRDVLADTDDLYRALRHAELAGQDSADVLADAVQGSFDGARSVPAVLAHRVRLATEKIPAPVHDSWLDRVPATADAEYRDFMTRLATAMDARQERLGTFMAETAPVWATQALGAVPDDPGQRAEWEQSAGRLAAYREAFGWSHEGQAIGPQPNTTHPEARAEWGAALAALAKVDGVDVRGLSDGLLFARRAAFERETSWAPADVAEELRVIHLARQDASTEAARCTQDAAASRRAGKGAWAALHDSRATDRQAVEAKCAALLASLEPAQQTRAEWEALTADTRRMALAADAELKRRGVLDPDEVMRSDEPEALVPGSVDEEHREATIRTALGLDSATSEATARVAELAERSRETQARIDEIRSMRQAEEDVAPAQAWAQLLGREREALIQNPEQYVTPSPDVEADEMAYDRETER
jgi:hypothetical protein